MAFLRDHEALQISDHECWTPIHAAIDRGHLDIANFLLDCGANVNTMSIHGDTPLSAAAQDGYETLAERLLERGATD